MNRRKLLSLLPLSLLGLPAAMKAERPAITREDFEALRAGQEAHHKKMSEALANQAEPSPWVEITCQRTFYYDRPDRLSVAEWIVLSPQMQKLLGVRGGSECGQRFKTLRLGATPYCPKCGCAQDISRPGIREHFTGIPC